jgi:hypothetical protein
MRVSAEADEPFDKEQQFHEGHTDLLDSVVNIISEFGKQRWAWSVFTYRTECVYIKAQGSTLQEGLGVVVVEYELEAFENRNSYRTRTVQFNTYTREKEREEREHKPRVRSHIRYQFGDKGFQGGHRY